MDTVSRRQFCSTVGIMWIMMGVIFVSGTAFATLPILRGLIGAGSAVVGLLYLGIALMARPRIGQGHDY